MYKNLGYGCVIVTGKISVNSLIIFSSACSALARSPTFSISSETKSKCSS